MLTGNALSTLPSFHFFRALHFFRAFPFSRAGESPYNRAIAGTDKASGDGAAKPHDKKRRAGFHCRISITIAISITPVLIAP
ncbi:hypothetical protein [Dentiradicibacter hellwigii]|mgnify:CR=1 FL=1|uniref:Uncharacterized protein n=1 Tax=Dentiradicibacter hellwigii TaxID=3149053 RepID=A0ABV4UC05_9RHOO